MALESLITAFKALCATLPDRRKGENTVYEMDDIGMAAFAVFFMQSPSFLAQQTALEGGRGSSNCQTLFAMRKIPADNHIRSMLDPVPPETLLPMFGKTLVALEEGGGLAAFQRLGGHVLIALDGTEYFCSQKLSCPNCSERKRANGKTEHFHAMVSAALVAPGHERALPLEPAFIVPQDGAEKQDCEARALTPINFPSPPQGWRRDETLEAKRNLRRPRLNQDIRLRATFLRCVAASFFSGPFVFHGGPHSGGHRPVQRKAEHEHQPVQAVGALDLAVLQVEAVRLVIGEHRLDAPVQAVIMGAPNGGRL